MKLSLDTFVGSIFGVSLLAWGVLSATKDWEMFLSQPSALIVFGGSVTAAFIGFRWRYLKAALFDILTIYAQQTINPKTLSQDVKMLIEWSKKIKVDGKKGLKEIIDGSNDNFVQYTLSLVSTGYKPEEVQDMASTSIEEHYYRRLTETNILNTMASSAPAFGMVGTLIGLIVMLGQMEDPSKMGPGLSMALLTTLYGVLVARFIFQPTSTKVKQKLGINRFREFLILNGILLIMEKKSPFYIQDKLNSYLDRKFHEDHVVGE
ncbi:MAG: MotA/TolQ/ExbB proton channel family protein [Fibrobacterales bacterium]